MLNELYKVAYKLKNNWMSLDKGIIIKPSIGRIIEIIEGL